jgi:hypothetical protein
MGVNMQTYFEVRIKLDDYTYDLLNDATTKILQLRQQLEEINEMGSTEKPTYPTKHMIVDAVLLLRHLDTLRVQLDYAIEKCERVENELESATGYSSKVPAIFD